MKHSYWLLALLVSLALAGRAQTLDPTFQATTLLKQDNSARVLALAAQPDGKSLVAGDFLSAGGVLSNNVLRLNTDLSRDLSFRLDLGANGPVQALAVQADGTILLGGSFTAYGGTATGPVARLLPTGELDPAFHLDPAVMGAGQVAVVVVQADGRILVGGLVSAGLPGGLVRLLPSGTLDPTFSSGTGAGSNGQVLTLAVQPTDSKILVGGAFESFNGRASQSLVRLLPDGTPDASFVPVGFNTGTVLYSVALHPSGDILVGGYWQSSAPTQTAVLKRLQPSGTPAPQFNATFTSISRVRSVQADASGRVLAAGYCRSYNNTGAALSTSDRRSVVRLLATGEPDPTFPPRILLYDDQPDYYALLPLATGQLLVGGRGAQGPAGLNLLTAAGDPDASLNLDLVLPQRGTVSTVVPLTNGQLLLNGTYATFNGQAVTGQLQRVQADGGLDQDVKLPTPTVSGSSFAQYGTLFPQPSGEVYAIVAARRCYTSCLDMEQWNAYLWRVRADNTLEPNLTSLYSLFNLGVGYATTAVQQVVRYPTGELLLLLRWPIFGSASSYTSLRKWQASGADVSSSLPALFVTPTGQNANTINQLVLQPDNKVVVNYQLVTSGTTNPVTQQGNLARLLTDGSLDSAFTVAPTPLLPPAATISTLVPQPDGKLLVQGSFTSFAGVATPTGVVRLLPSGAVDASFQPPASLAPLVPLACLPDGRLLVRANNQPGTASLRQLLTDGTLDPSFAPVAVTVAGSAVTSWNVVLQPGDSKPVLYGDFDAVAGQPRTGLARLSAATPLATRPGSGASQVLTVYPNPAHGSATLRLATALAQAGTVQLYDNLGREVRHQPAPAHAWELTLPLAGLRPGLYWLRCGAATGRLAVE